MSKTGRVNTGVFIQTISMVQERAHFPASSTAMDMILRTGSIEGNQGEVIFRKIISLKAMLSVAKKSNAKGNIGK